MYKSSVNGHVPYGAAPQAEPVSRPMPPRGGPYETGYV